MGLVVAEVGDEGGWSANGCCCCCWGSCVCIVDSVGLAVAVAVLVLLSTIVEPIFSILTQGDQDKGCAVCFRTETETGIKVNRGEEGQAPLKY
jgi:hypothetical protein